jgi:SAM-dependent methyltransferase
MKQPVARSYRDHFDAREASAYVDMFSPGTYGSLLWKIEQDQLAGLLREFRVSHSRVEYLDFACGTGRVLGFLEDQVDRATGIDVSADMLERARARTSRSELLQTDICAANVEPEGRYDLITAFRFILNAEPELRGKALRALAARLRDRTSWLIFNNHGNAFSHRAALRPLHALRRAVRPDSPMSNHLSHRQVVALAADAGLSIRRVLGCGFLSGKLLAVTPFDSLLRCEQQLARVHRLSAVGVNQLYVATRAN